jgi:hypothetical protein
MNLAIAITTDIDYYKIKKSDMSTQEKTNKV